MDCIFCQLDRPRIAHNNLAFAIADGFPVSLGHALVIPNRHVAHIFDLLEEEYLACFALLRTVKASLETQHHPDGFTVGINCGVAAGQSVMHAHIHVIPRYKGDVEEPLGGVRNIMPGGGPYSAPPLR